MNRWEIHKSMITKVFSKLTSSDGPPKPLWIREDKRLLLSHHQASGTKNTPVAHDTKMKSKMSLLLPVKAVKHEYTWFGQQIMSATLPW